MKGWQYRQRVATRLSLRRALPRRALNTELVCSILNVQVFAFGIVHKLQFFGGRRGQFS
jgi:hypothetical protein